MMKGAVRHLFDLFYGKYKKEQAKDIYCRDTLARFIASGSILVPRLRCGFIGRGLKKLYTKIISKSLLPRNTQRATRNKSHHQYLKIGGVFSLTHALTAKQNYYRILKYDL
jgi:hypothetical protein